MLNQIVIVGRLVEAPEIKETETGKKVCKVTISVPRSYKNLDGEYENDIIDCIVWNGIAENTVEYRKKGDLLGIKGRIQSEEIEFGGKIYRKSEVVAEKITFLSNGKGE